MDDLKQLLQRFADCGWELIALPSRAYLAGEGNTGTLRAALEQAQQECGSCGCELDPLYPRALALLK